MHMYEAEGVQSACGAQHARRQAPVPSFHLVLASSAISDQSACVLLQTCAGSSVSIHPQFLYAA
eukprot:1140553-Pelagomonas_calceolata.AAC.8